MSQRTEHPFSEEDHQLLKEHQLGRPLHVYTLRRGYILFNRIAYLLEFLLCIAFVWLLIFSLLIVIEPSIMFDLLVYLGGLVALLAAGWYLWVHLRHEEQSRRLLIGTDGLLEIKKLIRTNYLKKVFWKDIRAVRKIFIVPEYLIQRRKGDFVILAPYVFRCGNELIPLIRKYVAEWNAQQ